MNGKVARKVGWNRTVKCICLQVKEFYFILVMVSQQCFLSKEVTWSNLNIRTINSSWLGREKIDTETAAFHPKILKCGTSSSYPKFI